MNNFTHKNLSAHNFIWYLQVLFFIKKNKNIIQGDVVDVGCGNKPYIDVIGNRCASYYGIDWIQNENNSVDLIMDLNNPIKIQNEKFNTVLLISVLEHVKNSNLLISECYRILRVNGVVLLQIPFMWRIHEEPHDYIRYTKYGLKSLLEDAGFRLINIRAQSGLWLSVAFKLNYALLQLIKGPAYLKLVIKIILSPILILSQIIGYILDKVYKIESETVGYFVVAVK